MRPKTVPGIGNLKTTCTIVPKKYDTRIIINCFKYFN